MELPATPARLQNITSVLIPMEVLLEICGLPETARRDKPAKVIAVDLLPHPQKALHSVLIGVEPLPPLQASAETKELMLVRHVMSKLEIWGVNRVTKQGRVTHVKPEIPNDVPVGITKIVLTVIG